MTCKELFHFKIDLFWEFTFRVEYGDGLFSMHVLNFGVLKLKKSSLEALTTNSITNL